MKGVLPVLGLLLLAVGVGACSGANPAPSGVTASADPNAVHISARDLKFSTAELIAPAGKSFSIVFDNQESAPHNVAIYRDSAATMKVFAEDPFGGPKTVTYQVTALAAGTYFFRCDLHTAMQGALTAK
jgi:plastocyanin